MSGTDKKKRLNGYFSIHRKRILNNITPKSDGDNIQDVDIERMGEVVMFKVKVRENSFGKEEQMRLSQTKKSNSDAIGLFIVDSPDIDEKIEAINKILRDEYISGGSNASDHSK